jgi:stage II sporulation protein AB (anti-sigma F factor)
MKKIINEMKLRLIARGESESLSRAIIAAFVAELNPTVEELLDLRCALSEAVTNCVVHAYPGLEGGLNCYIYISVRIYENREVSIEIRDTGVGIADIDRVFSASGATERALTHYVMFALGNDEEAYTAVYAMGNKRVEGTLVPTMLTADGSEYVRE